ncbi:MAG TPA: hypothetical protein VL461_08910 [Dictyobacter sp.]|nr:hypothetical protein [Dictyobacter sp.]
MNYFLRYARLSLLALAFCAATSSHVFAQTSDHGNVGGNVFSVAGVENSSHGNVGGNVFSIAGVKNSSHGNVGGNVFSIAGTEW